MSSVIAVDMGHQSIRVEIHHVLRRLIPRNRVVLKRVDTLVTPNQPVRPTIPDMGIFFYLSPTIKLEEG